MSLMWILYWIDVAGRIQCALSAALLLLGSLIGLTSLFVLIEDGTKRLLELRVISKALLVWALIALFYIFVPSTSTMYAMLAADAGEKLVQSEEMRQIGGKALKILNDKLDELSGDKKEK